MELNPSNKALTELRDHWQKVLVAVMKKQGIKEVELTGEDFARIFPVGGRIPFLVVQGLEKERADGGFRLLLCDDQKEAMEIVAKWQGRG